MNFETLLTQWANEQGFQAWSRDHAAVLRNLGSWLNQNAAQPPFAPDVAICAPELHVQQDEQGFLFCHWCGKPLHR